MASIEQVNAHFGMLSVQLSHFRKGALSSWHLVRAFVFVWLFCARMSHLVSTQTAGFGRGCLLFLFQLSNQANLQNFNGVFTFSPFDHCVKI